MAVSRQRRNVVYGVGQPLYDMTPQPISSTRAPKTSDMAELNTVWSNKSTSAAWILTGIASNSATWTPTTVNAGATITTGDFTVTAGDIIATAGDVTVSAGSIGVTLGGISVAAGNIAATLGTIVAGLTVTATTDLIAVRSAFVGGDEGTGFATSLGLTNVIDTTLSTGAGKVLMKTANPGDSSGWLKFYHGTDIRYIPFWTTLSP